MPPFNKSKNIDAGKVAQKALNKRKPHSKGKVKRVKGYALVKDGEICNEYPYDDISSGKIQSFAIYRSMELAQNACRVDETVCLCTISFTTPKNKLKK